MAKIVVNVSEIMGLSSKGSSVKNTVANVKAGIGMTQSGIDSKILNRNGIGTRLNNVSTQVGQIERDIASICASVSVAALKYQNTENLVVGYANSMINANSFQRKMGSIGGGSVYYSYFHEGPVDSVTECDDINKKNVWDYLNIGLSGIDYINGFLTDFLPEEELVLAGEMISKGICFGVNKGSNGKIYLYMDNLKNLTHAEIADILKKCVTDVNLTDYDIRTLINDGIDLYTQAGNMTKKGTKIVENILDSTDDLLDMSSILKSCKSIPDKIKNAGSIAWGEFWKELNLFSKFEDSFKAVDNIEDFSPLISSDSVNSNLGKAVKAGKVLGLVGDVITVGTEFFENNYNETTQSWEITSQSIVSTVTDVGVDLVTSAGASAAGAAIGSFIVPPVGTVVGAVAGIAIDAVINWEFDFDGDGEAYSAVDKIKEGVDFISDKIGDWFN